MAIITISTVPTVCIETTLFVFIFNFLFKLVENQNAEIIVPSSILAGTRPFLVIGLF